MRSLLARAADMLRRRQRDRDLDAEIAVHLELAASDLQARGLDPDAATRAALKQFGGVLRTREAEREVRSFVTLDALWSALRDTQRSFRRTPSATGVLLLTLMVGIGVTTVVFSVVYGVLLKPLPFESADRLVVLYHRMPGFGSGEKGPQSPATYFTYRDHNRVFEDIGLWLTSEIAITLDGTAERVEALRVTDGVLPMLRVRPLLGTLIAASDDVPGAPNRVMLTYGYWQRAFGAQPNVVGRLLTIDTAPYEIIGVLPASFTFLDAHPQVVLPLRPDRARAAPGAGFGPKGIGRLEPGVTLAQANGDIARMLPLIVEQFPLPAGVTQEMWDSVGLAPNVRPLSDEVIGESRRLLWVLLAVAVIVLLVACANVANLLLVRGEGRRRELAVRCALGASGARVARQLLSESVCLALGGGMLGLLLAEIGVRVLRYAAPEQLPRAGEIGIDSVVLGFTLTVSVVTAFLFGTLPAWKFGTLHVAALKEAGRSASDAPGRHRTRNVLVVVQLALALVLLVVSGLMVRTFFALQRVDPGFARPADVETFRVTLPPGIVRDPTQLPGLYQRIAESLHQVPGVQSVGLTSRITMDGPITGFAPIFLHGQPFAGTPPARQLTILGPGYFETMGNPIVAGRSIAWSDVFELRPVALVSATLAHEYFGEPATAVGQQIGGTPDGPWFEIVGVAGDTRENGLNQPAPPVVYMPLGGTFSRRSMSYVVRSPRAGTPALVRDLQHAVSSVSANVPIGDARTLVDIQADSMAQTSFAMTMLGLAASVAVLLSLVGVYGVVSFVVAERTAEICIRMALGARAADVRRLFLRHGLLLTGAGIVIGIGAAMLVTPVMSGLVYGISPLDPLTYLTMAIALVAVSLAATYLPARRASRVPPMAALRSST